MILTAAEVKAFIPTSTLNATYLDKHESRAILKHMPKYLGVNLTKELLSTTPSVAITTLIEQLKGAIANLAYLEALPFIDLVSTNTGFGVVSNSNIAPASAQRVNNFKDAALAAAKDYLSDSLIFLELNQANYPTWNKSSLIEGGIIGSIDEWPNIIDISYSREKFVNLAPFIRQAERMWLAKKLSSEFVAVIAGSADVNVLPDIQKALAFYAHFLKEKESLKKDTTGMEGFNKKNLDTANDYLNSCIDFLNKNLIDYPVYTEFGFNEPFQNDLEENGFLKMG